MGESLDSSSNLQSLELKLFSCDELHTYYQESEQTLYRSVFRMISHCHQSLRQISLHFHGYDPLHLWENEPWGPVVDWVGAAETFKGFKELEQVIIHFHNPETTETFKPGTCESKVDEIVRAFARDAPELALMNIFELGLNLSFFSLHDGTKIPDKPVHRCKVSDCWGASAGARVNY